MSRRNLLLILLVLCLALGLAIGQAEASPPQPDEEKSPLGDDGTLCVAQLVWRDHHACPRYGPATTAARVASIHLPDPLPELSVLPLNTPDDAVAPHIYAQVIEDNAPVYGHPIEAVYDLPPKRRLGVGFIWVSVQGRTTFEGRDYYQINASEYVPVEVLGFYNPSAFQGIALAAQPERPFAWILTPVRPSLTPGGEANDDAPIYHRYNLVQIFAVEHLGDQVWYLIGPDQWINQITVGVVKPSAAPEGVEPGAAWVDINLFEQTLAAYVGDRLVYGTLVSTGLPGWNTPPGLFQVWHKAETGKMSGAHNKPDYYFLEDVPWSMYFNQDIALHGAYWHNSFGYRHSHGCVNLAPADAGWLFSWAPETLWVRVQSGQAPALHQATGN